MKVTWVCKNYGDVTTTEAGQFPELDGCQKSLLHDWYPIEEREGEN